jgi:cytochrome c heme-lyase
MKESANESASNSGCPVQHTATRNDVTGATSANYFSFLWGSKMIPAASYKDSKEATTSSTCPVKREDHEMGNIPASLEEAARHDQNPQPGQQITLQTDRQISTIPRGDSEIPLAHQLSTESSSDNWVYPSEQQMFNAMKKKGWTNVPEDSIPVVLQIHNNINERTWNQIQSWEGTTDSLNLVRFMGRPNDTSPKAFLFSYLLRLYDPPFDRHDWYVQNSSSGLVRRYVIDFYYLQHEHPDMPPIPYVDARPALDHPYALYLHGRRFLQLAFPGITSILKKQWWDPRS